jgi:hypothetical protein
MRANLQGDPKLTPLIETVSDVDGKPRIPEGMAVDREARKIYWVEPDSMEIKVAPLSGGKSSNLASGPCVQYPVALALDVPDHRLYWAEAAVDYPGEEGHIKFAYTDGRTSNTPRDIFHSLSIARVTGIASDTRPGVRRIYWHTSGGKLQSLDLDGNEKMPTDYGLPEGSSTQAGGLAYDPSQNKFYWADYGVNLIGWAIVKGSKVIKHDGFKVAYPWPLSVFADLRANRLYWGYRKSPGASIEWTSLNGDATIHSLPFPTTASGIEVVYP